MPGCGRGIINPKNLGYGVPLAIIGGKFKASATTLADLNDDCTLALLKRFSSAQLFTFVSSPDFSNRRLRDCAMVALKDVYAPFSLKSSINAEGTSSVFVADAKNGNMAVLKHPDLFHLSPLSVFLEKAEIHLTSDDPSNEKVWLNVARSISVSQLLVFLTYVKWNTPFRVPTMRLMQAFGSAQSLCISFESHFERAWRDHMPRFEGDLRHRELEDVLEAVRDGLLRRQLRSLQLVARPDDCVWVAMSLYAEKLGDLLTFYLPRAASLESIDLRGAFIKPSRCIPGVWPSAADPHACELLLCSMLDNLKANRTLKCIKLRCYIQSISKLQEKLPEGCKIAELNGESVLSEEILKRMHCSPDTVVIVQEKQGMNEEGQVEWLYLHVDCALPLTV